METDNLSVRLSCGVLTPEKGLERLGRYDGRDPRDGKFLAINVDKPMLLKY